jgi:hypothetical protein
MNFLQRIFGGKSTDHVELGTKGRSRWWRIVAQNGNILATSETYRNRMDRDEIARAFAARNRMEIRGIEFKGEKTKVNP